MIPVRSPLHDPEEVPFRLIAIVSTTNGVDDLYDLARRWPGIGFGLMLRDPGHRHERVEALAAHALGAGAPPGVTLVANAFPVPGISWLHGTAAMLNTVGPGGIEPSEMRTGYSVHDLAEAELAVAAGARYVTFSPVFPTASKPGHPGTGRDALRRICAAIPIPVFALGGITGSNARTVLDAGAYGIASISLFAPDSRAELAALLRSLPRSSNVNRQS